MSALKRVARAQALTRGAGLHAQERTAADDRTAVLLLMAAEEQLSAADAELGAEKLPAYCHCCGCVTRYCNCTKCSCGCGR